jgi:hypothetical protein
MKKSSIVAVVSIAVIGGLAYFTFALHERHENRAKIRSLAIELSDHQPTIDELRQLLQQPRFQGLNLQEESPSQWTVETPLEFGAKNWILSLEVTDSKIVAICVRTPDTPNSRPADAPPDKRFQDGH